MPRKASAFGRGGIDEQLMGKPQTDIYKSTGDYGMVKRPPKGGAAAPAEVPRTWSSPGPGGRRGIPEGGVQSLKKGGKVKRTGPVKLHKGEKVVKAKKPVPRRRRAPS
jgi:hypothetical protein